MTDEKDPRQPLRLVTDDEPVDDAAGFDDEFDDELPSRGLLSFYDRLRDRIVAAVEKKGGKWGERTADALLLVPDVFMLLTRLALDKEVPKETRALIGGALAYFILPIDLLPEAFVGPVGYLDDLVLALTVLSQAFSGDLEPFAEKYWSGSEKLRKVMRDVLVSAEHLLGTDLYNRLRDLLSKNGIELDQQA